MGVGNCKTGRTGPASAARAPARPAPLPPTASAVVIHWPTTDRRLKSKPGRPLAAVTRTPLSSNEASPVIANKRRATGFASEPHHHVASRTANQSRSPCAPQHLIGDLQAGLSRADIVPESP